MTVSESSQRCHPNIAQDGTANIREGSDDIEYRLVGKRNIVHVLDKLGALLWSREVTPHEEVEGILELDLAYEVRYGVAAILNYAF
jgi:hypothetical protein